MSLSQVFTRDNPVFAAYAFYASVLVLKMLAMSVLTARQRIKNKVFANPEDAVGLKGKVKFDHPDVERVRRAHLNDLENIPTFLLVAILYVLTNPTPLIAINLFRAFTVARVVHTLVYAVVVVPQPARGLAWGIGYAITIYIAVQNVLFFL
ncbi:microsomal glutathione S-transferase 1 [Anabrus simplex]|uniref:microsomal glutathione S-transferase 1 n=1 Tax=Anabrus simplex TaxID=316456 RepID=UPI0034DD4170